MKTYQKRITIIGLWLISVAASFCAGAFLIYEYYVFGDPVSSLQSIINVDPPVDGPLYSVEQYVRANNAVKAHLEAQLKKAEFKDLRPRFIVCPEEDGYTIYCSSGRRGTAFPKNLYDSTMEVMKKNLGEIRKKPITPDAK